MIPLHIVFWVLVIHWLADFKFQTHWMASNKSTSNKALGAHVLVYGAFMIPLGIIMFSNVYTILLFVHVNVCWHFCTDYVTSRLTSFRWKQQRWHDFFEVVGVDQSIHYFTIFGTYLLLQ